MRVGWRIAEVVIELVLHAHDHLGGRLLRHHRRRDAQLGVVIAVDARLHLAALEVVPQVAAARDVVELARCQIHRRQHVACELGGADCLARGGHRDRSEGAVDVGGVSVL